MDATQVIGTTVRRVETTQAPKARTASAAVSDFLARFEAGEFNPFNKRIVDGAEYRRVLNRLRAQLGERYWACTLDNFEVYDAAAQAPVLSRLRAFAENMPRQLSGGGGMILLGRPGTGKDHLLSALLKTAVIAHKLRVEWYDGGTLRNVLMDAACQGTITEVESRLCQAHILAISDPVPPRGDLTAPYLSRLRDLIDRRYRRLVSTWITTNVDTPKDAEELLTAPVLERLREGSGQVFCDWASYRPRKQATW
jgi:DNA replication protein DnaC